MPRVLSLEEVTGVGGDAVVLEQTSTVVAVARMSTFFFTTA